MHEQNNELLEDMHHNSASLQEKVLRLTEAVERLVENDSFGELARDLVKYY